MRTHIPALDGLRGIAILLVLFTHLLPHRSVGPILLRLLNGVAGVGWSGVDIFFVLSGFLITGILYDAKRDDHYFRDFYMRRTLRIVPLYLLVVFCCTSIFPHFAATQGSSPAANRWMFWLYLSNVLVAFRGAISVGWLGPLWSLAVEEHFYLIWPTVILLCSRRSAMQVCMGCVVLANAVRLIFLMHHNLLGPYVFTLSRIDELALGALVALALRGNTSQREMQTFARWGALAAGAGTLTLFVWRHGVILDPVMLGVGLPIVGALSTALLTLAVLPGTAAPWKALLQSGFLKRFGRYSYGLYMLHMPVWEVLRQHHLLFQGQNRLLDVANLVIGIGASYLLAVLVFHYFEKPFLRLKRYFEPTYRRLHAAEKNSFVQDPAASSLPMEARS